MRNLKQHMPVQPPVVFWECIGTDKIPLPEVGLGGHMRNLKQHMPVQTPVGFWECFRTDKMPLP